MIDIVTKRRLGRTLSAQLYNQTVTVACQLGLVPLLLWAWGTQRYGAWLVLTAVPTFLTFSDFGFTFVAKNEMVIAVAAGNKPKAKVTFQSIFALLNIVAPVIACVAMVLIFGGGLVQMLSVQAIPLPEAQLTLMAFTLNVLLYQYFLLVCAGIRAENRPASESIWAATSRLAESIMFGLSALATANVAVAAMLGLLVRIVFLVAAYGSLRRLSPWLSFGRDAATRSEIARLAHPAFAYMLVPIAQALLIQGPIVIIGKLAGPLSVVIFSTSRTLARVGTSVTNMFNNTFVAEYSATAGRGDFSRFRQLRRAHLFIGAPLIACYVITLLFFGEWLIGIFTHGKVQIIQPFFLLMALAVAAEMGWSAQFTAIVAVNRHKVVTYCLALVSILGLTTCYFLVPNHGIAGAAIALLGVHLTMVLVCAWVTLKLSRLEKENAAAPIQSA
ncbi:MAG: teichoic acid transporter [Sphingobium sp.]